MGLSYVVRNATAPKVQSVIQTGTPYPTTAQKAAYHDPVSAALSLYDKPSKKGTELVHKTAKEIGFSVLIAYRNKFCQNTVLFHHYRSKHVGGPLSPGLQ
jgi:hypothetical protein